MRHPETGKLLVNFDPKILEVVRETKCMIKMKLDVPEQAKRLLKLESKLKADKLYLQVRRTASFDDFFLPFCMCMFMSVCMCACGDMCGDQRLTPSVFFSSFCLTFEQNIHGLVRLVG